MCNKCDKQFNYKILHSLYCNKHKLDKIIKTLIIIVDKQQKEINELKKWTKPLRKKLNILKWLNDKPKPNTHLQSWINDIHIGQQELNIILKCNFKETLFTILQTYITDDIPIKCFHQKPNVFYVFNGEKWVVLDDFYHKIFYPIYFKILLEFKTWRHENSDMIFDEHKCISFNQNIKKILNTTNIPEFIKSKLYNHLKYNLKNITIYDFI